MPRLSPSLLRRARLISPYLAALLPACRDLPSAAAELRWIREHAVGGPAGLAARLVRRRARGEPLQYVLGTQPFGRLELACRPGVLIPRCVPKKSQPPSPPLFVSSSSSPKASEASGGSAARAKAITTLLPSAVFSRALRS